MKAIVTLANNKGNYRQGLARLSDSLRNNFDGDFFGYTDEKQVGAPKHSENMYAFKIYAIDAVRAMGYTQILWLDSSVYAVANVQPVFDVIEQEGYIMQEAGHYVGDWCNERTLRYFGITREEANKMLMYGNAGFLGLNFDNDLAAEFFKGWKIAMEDGQFIGDWSDHRHDMTCGSIIANDLGMKYKKGDEWLQYAGIYDKIANDTIIFKAAGL